MKNLLILLSVVLIGCQPSSQKQEFLSEKKDETDQKSASNKKSIVFFGDSITAGYQLDLSEAFPALIGEIIDSLGLDYEVVNAGLSGETTASGNSRISWVLKNRVDILVLELGANDGLRGIKTEETIKNMQSIIDKINLEYPEAKIILAGMQIPPNLGVEYSKDFRDIFTTLATKNNITLIPFLLESVAGLSDLNLDDGIHPNVEGHKIVADNVWKVLEKEL